MQSWQVRLVPKMVACGPQKYIYFSHSFLTILGLHGPSVTPPMPKIPAFFHPEMKWGQFLTGSLNRPRTCPLCARLVPIKLMFLKKFLQRPGVEPGASITGAMHANHYTTGDVHVRYSAHQK